MYNNYKIRILTDNLAFMIKMGPNMSITVILYTLPVDIDNIIESNHAIRGTGFFCMSVPILCNKN